MTRPRAEHYMGHDDAGVRMDWTANMIAYGLDLNVLYHMARGKSVLKAVDAVLPEFSAHLYDLALERTKSAKKADKMTVKFYTDLLKRLTSKGDRRSL